MNIPNTYQFVATFADGSQIFQNEQDVSELNSENNCFFDVLSRPDQPVSFVITDGTNVFGVDLRDGHFECNGIPFFQHRPEHQKYKDFRLVYYRTPEIDIDQKSGTATRGKIAAYTIGWEVGTVEKTFTVYFE